MPSTTSASRQPPEEKGLDPVTVLVTGFGPFLDRFPQNASWLIASRLPALLPSTPSHPTPIHIHVHHAPVRVAYHSVADLVPRLLPPLNSMYPPPTIVLHTGMAAGRSYYTLERTSSKLNYGVIPDVDGRKFSDREAEEMFPRSCFPPVLETSFDTEDVLERWRGNLTFEVPSSTGLGQCGSGTGKLMSISKHDVRNSPDGGNFLCGFIYWNSLAHYYSLGKEKIAAAGRAGEAGEEEPILPVAFMHVPDLREDKVQGGVEVAVGLIRALVDSYREVGLKSKGTDLALMGKEKTDMDVNFVAQTFTS